LGIVAGELFRGWLDALLSPTNSIEALKDKFWTICWRKRVNDGLKTQSRWYVSATHLLQPTSIEFIREQIYCLLFSTIKSRPASWFLRPHSTFLYKYMAAWFHNSLDQQSYSTLCTVSSNMAGLEKIMIF